METDAEFDKSTFPHSENLSPTDHHPKLKSLNKIDSSSKNEPSTSFPLDRDNESDGLDPLFGEPNHFLAKRALDFDVDGGAVGMYEDEVDFGWENDKNNEEIEEKKKKKKRQRSVEFQGDDSKEKTRKVRSSDLRKNEKKAVFSKRKAKKEREAHLVELANYQRVMRERKGVGFKPAPMVEKSISSVLEKIRQRRLEVSKKRVVFTDKDQANEDDEGVVKVEPKEDGGGTDRYQAHAAPVETMTSEDKPHSSNEQTTNENPPVEEITQSLRAPIDETQYLFVDSERSNLQGDELNESSIPVEDLPPSAPSLSLQLDSDFADHISSSDEGSDKENIDPHPKRLLKKSTPVTDDPVKKFLDEEALEDDSDDDHLNFQEKDEEDNSDVEENCDYIANDVEENQIDREKGNQKHQQWLQQQDDAATDYLLQKLNHGTKQREVREPSISDDEDADRTDNEGYVSDQDVLPAPASHITTRKLKQMIPQIFTDKDDEFVSSDDEETERRLTKQYLLQKVGMEQQSKFLSPVDNETSSEVIGRIKKIHVIPETTKKAKQSSNFDSLLIKGTSSNSSKSSFLRRASSHPAPSSHRQVPSTGRSFIFGRDDSNSRSSMSLLEDSPNLVDEKESQLKKNKSSKFVSFQAKRSTQHTEMKSETVYGTSLFDILRCSSVQTGYDNQDNAVDHQAVFAAFKSVKKQVKIERSY